MKIMPKVIMSKIMKLYAVFVSMVHNQLMVVVLKIVQKIVRNASIIMGNFIALDALTLSKEL